MDRQEEPYQFNYILNDVAFYNLAVKCMYDIDPNSSDKRELLHQIDLIQKQVSELKSNVYLKNECLSLIPKFLNNNGRETQIAMSIEEMSELIKELIKNNFRDKDNKKEVLEELGDVMFCMNTLMYIYETNEKELFEVLYKKLQEREMIGVDTSEESDTTVESCRDIMRNCTYQRFYQGGKLIKVLKIDYDGTTEDVPLDEII